MNIKKYLSSLGIVIPLFISLINAEPDPNFHIYLLFGQSNMAGGGNTSNLITQDCDTSPRVKVLAFSDCSAGSGPSCKQYPLKRTHDQWYTAYPPLHICSEGISPGDWFAKTMLDSIREDITIGLVPCALSGQTLKVFEKGGSNFNIPTWAHPTLGNSSPYEWMLKRCKIAQETGVIKGFLFHQGENDVGQNWWVNTAKGIFDNLKKDLGLDNTLPVVVGELVQDQGACCASHNTLVNKLASEYPNCGVASSKDLKKKSGDQYNAHFDSPGMRELGKRYAQTFLSLADQNYVPRKGTVAIKNTRNSKALTSKEINTSLSDFNIYTLDGRAIRISGINSNANVLRQLKPGNIYLLIDRQTGRNSRFLYLK